MFLFDREIAFGDTLASLTDVKVEIMWLFEKTRKSGIDFDNRAQLQFKSSDGFLKKLVLYLRDCWY